MRLSGSRKGWNSCRIVLTVSQSSDESPQSGGSGKRTVDSWQVLGGVAGVLSLLGSWAGAA
jgi:hypothetical protein